MGTSSSASPRHKTALSCQLRTVLSGAPMRTEIFAQLALEGRGQLWPVFSDFDGLLTGSDLLTPLRADADKYSFSHVPSPSLSVPLEYSVYNVFPCPSVRYGRKTSSTLAIPASIIAI